MDTKAAIKLAVPVLSVADVERSIRWYQKHLGFVGDPFPEVAPYSFAILRHGSVELMLQCNEKLAPLMRKPYEWDVYLRLESSPFRDAFAHFSDCGIVTRRLERMFYGLCEFEITDPDGHVLCLSQFLDNADDLPTPKS